MSWDQEPPTKDEIRMTSANWFDQPPSEDEVKQAEPGRPWYAFDVNNLVPGAMAGLKKIDEYTGAPIRKFVTEAVTGDELKQAPTGAEQAKMMGATTKTYGEVFDLPEWVPGRDVSPADIYGVGLEMIQDPFVIGSGLKKVYSGAAKGVDAISDVVRPSIKQTAKGVQSQAAEAGARGASKAEAVISGGGLDVEQGGKLFEFKAPQTLDELRAWRPESGAGALPGKARLQQIESTVTDLKTKPLKYHYDMMENPKAMKELKLQFENLPTEDAKKIAAYNQQIVDESAQKIRETVGRIAGNVEPKNLTDAGYDFIATAKDKYNAEREALAPLFEKLKTNSVPISQNDARAVAVAIGENSKVGPLMAIDTNAGKIVLKGNTPRSGVSDAEFGVIKRVIDDLNDGMTFQEIQRTREFLRKSIDPANPGATEEISKVRSILLDQLEQMAEKQGPSVGQTFKAYAKNERARESIERVIGGKIESLDAMFAANPDKVVQKIFSSPNYAKVVGDYVGPEKMQELVASYINNGISKSFDQATGFKPHELRNWLKKNEAFLRTYVEPSVVERISSLADYGYYGKRFLDEVNPSGTAASLQAMIEPTSFMQRVKQQGITGAVQSTVANKVDVALKQKQAIKALNEALGGMDPRVQDHLMKKIMQGVPNFSQAIDSGVKFQGTGSSLRNLIQEQKIPRASENNDDGASNFENTMGKDALLQKTQGTKYGQVLQNAAGKSEQSLSAAHYVLSQRDPEYRKVTGGK